MARRNKKPKTDDEKKTKDPPIEGDLAVAFNKKGESDNDALKRVQKTNPGSKIIEEEDIGIAENKTEKPGEPEGSGDAKRGGKPGTNPAGQSPDDKKQATASADPPPPTVEDETVPDPTVDIKKKVVNIPTEPVGLNVIPPTASQKDTTINVSADELMHNTSAPVNVSVTQSPTTLIFRNGVYTAFPKMSRLETRDKEPYFDGFAFKMGTFSNPKEFEEQKLALVGDIIKAYEHIYQDFTAVAYSDFIPENVTTPGSIGWDAFSDKGGELYEHKAQIWNWWTQPGRIGVRVPRGDKLNKTFDAFVHPSERRLQQGLADNMMSLVIGGRIDGKANVRGIHQYHSFVRGMLTNINQGVDAIKNVQVLQFQYLTHWLSRDSSGIAPFIAGSRLFQGLLVDYMDNLVSTMMLPLIDSSVEIGRMMKALQVRTGVAGIANDIPQTMSGANAIVSVRNLLTALTMGRYMRLNIDVDVGVFNMVELFNCLMRKLLMPDYAFTREAININDNYIAAHLLPSFGARVFDPDIVEIDVLTANHGSVNYLSLMLTNGSIKDNALRRRLYDFLYSDMRGHGWLNTEGQQYQDFASIIPNHDMFVPYRTGPLCVTMTGVVDFDRKTEPMQMRAFRKMKAAISGHRAFRFEDTSAHRAFTPLMNMAAEIRMGDYIYMMNNYLFHLGKVGYAAPVDPTRDVFIRYDPVNDEKTEDFIRRLNPRMGMYSYHRLGRPGDAAIPNFTTDLIKFDMLIHEDIKEFIFWWNYIFKVFDFDKRLTKGDKIAKVFAMTRTRTSILKVLELQLVGDEKRILVVPDESVATSPFLQRRIDLANSFMNNMSRFLGYAPSFVYDPRPEIKEDNSYYDFEPLPRNVAPHAVLDINGLKDLLLQSKAFFKLLRAANAANNVIIFNIPVHYTTERIKDDEIKQASPITYSGTDKMDVSIGSITKYVVEKRSFIDRDTNEAALWKEPYWHVPSGHRSTINEPLVSLMNIFHHRVGVARKEIRVADPFNIYLKF